MDEILDMVLEASRIVLSPGESDIYWEDGTLMYKLECWSSWDASEQINKLTDIASDLQNNG
jgi:hypothetical protein